MNMSVDYAAIGQRIKGRRREQKRTQEWLAEQLQVSVGYISQIERGVTKVNLDTLSEIAPVWVVIWESWSPALPPARRFTWTGRWPRRCKK